MGGGHLNIAASRSHSDTPHSVGLLQTSDQPDAVTSTQQRTALTDIHVPGGIRPAIPLSERPQTRAVDLAATGISTTTTIAVKLINMTSGL